MDDPALQWLNKKLPELLDSDYAESHLASRLSLMTCWLWMDERFDTRLNGLLGAILTSWKHIGRVPTILLVNRVTPALRRLSEKWGILLVVKPEIRGGGGNVKDLNRDSILHLKEYFDTEYVLTFQDHAFPLRSGIEEFLGKWDYIGAPWNFDCDDWITRILLPRRGHVGNGAFTLRSRELCERISYYYQRHFRFFPHCYLFNDDYFIGKTLPSWEPDYRKRIRIPPPEIAARFALENNRQLQDEIGVLPFGFHGPDAWSYLVEKGYLKL